MIHELASGLFIMRPCSIVLALAALAFSSSTSASPSCKSDLDCSLNGVCDLSSGACQCDSPWVSDLGTGDPQTLPGCSYLDFLPSPVSPCGPACAFHGGPSSLDVNWTSWGMSVLQVSPTEFHGFVAEMANECSLSAWTKGSQVIHTTASSPLGPFLRVAGAPVVPPWSHNPQHITAPDGTHVIYTLGDGWAQNGPPLNCSKGAAAPAAAAAPAPTAPLRGLGNCTVLAHPANCNPNPCWACNITLHTAADVNGAPPWTPHTAQIIGLSNFDNIGNYNPAPLVLANGSIALMIHTDDNQGWSGESIAIAQDWRGPYVVTVGNEQVANLPKSQEE